MTCFKPLQAISFRNPISPDKKKILILSSVENAFPITHENPLNPFPHEELVLPCGQCIGCRLQRSKEWSSRCWHEASLYADNCFITLTYRPEDLPAQGSLNKTHFQLFMKRLRKHYGPHIRYFMCGEYGENLAHPHFHAILFNFDFDDKKFFKMSSGNKLYRSSTLERLWPFGHSTIGTATQQSAGYVARYCVKKITGDLADDHYKRCDRETGLVYNLCPEYTCMSRRPGIGRDWIDLFLSDVYPHDFVVIDNKKLKTPRYYDKQYEISDADALALLKLRRKEKALEHSKDQTPDRLKIREECTQAKYTKLIREYENQGPL